MVVDCIGNVVSRPCTHFIIVVFDDELHENNYKMLELLDTIKGSIRNACEGFYLCYQPFVSTISGRVIGAEALIRCYADGKKVMICGNGGSCADADHIAGELMKGFLKIKLINQHSLSFSNIYYI